MKWLISTGLAVLILLTHPAIADDNFKTLKFSDNDQFYQELQEEVFLKTSFQVVTDFTHPEQVPVRLNNLLALDQHGNALVDKNGSFIEGAKTTAILTLAGASLASAIGTGAVVGSAFFARSIVAGAAVGAAGAPLAPAIIAVAAGVGAVVGFTLGVTVVIMSGDDHEMTFEVDPTGKFRFHVRPV
ncbi:membrane protein [Beggiatoa sp. PS]|nr:membrane protein [Beggiatoa sp. PS]